MNESVVEWFAKQVLAYKSPTNVNGTDYILIPVDKIDFLKEQSKEMEKEQSLKVPSYDLDELADIEFSLGWNSEIRKIAFKKGFQKALELLTFKSE